MDYKQWFLRIYLLCFVCFFAWSRKKKKYVKFMAHFGCLIVSVNMGWGDRQLPHP